MSGRAKQVASAGDGAVGLETGKVGKGGDLKKKGARARKPGAAERRETRIEMRRGGRTMAKARFQFKARRLYQKYFPGVRIGCKVFDQLQLMCEDRQINQLYADEAVIRGSSKKLITLTERVYTTRNEVHARVGHYRPL